MKVSELKAAVDNIQAQLAGDDPDICIECDFDKVKISDMRTVRHVYMESGGYVNEVILKIVRL